MSSWGILPTGPWLVDPAGALDCWVGVEAEAADVQEPASAHEAAILVEFATDLLLSALSLGDGGPLLHQWH